MEEIWKDIVGYEGYYQVSSFGRVKELERTYYCGHRNEQMSSRPERIMQPQLNHKGYLMISLSKNGKRKTFTVHRLVAAAFIPNDGNLPQVNHIDENKLNNCVDNLEWCTNGYNLRYGTGRLRRIEKMKGRKVSDEHKKKISKANSGANNGMYGKTPWNKGMKLPGSAWNKGKSWSNEVIEKLKNVDHSVLKRPIIMDGEIRFDGIIDAVKFLGNNAVYKSIRRVLTGERKTYRGHTFKYAN